MSIAFSIIIPVGPGRDAHPALASLVEAGLKASDEVILVGDGHEPVVPEAYAALPLRIGSLQPGEGANAVRNEGVRLAVHGSLCFLDDDDAYAPHALTRLRLRIREFPELQACSLGWRFRSGRSSRSHARPARLTEANLRKRNLAGGCSSMVLTRQAFEAAGGFDPAMPAMQDWDLWLRVAQHGAIEVLHDIHVLYEDRHLGRISTNAERRIAGFERLLEKYGADWTPAELAFHESRLAATRFSTGLGPWWTIFRWRAPLASAYFMWRAFRNRRASDASSKFVQSL